MSRVSALQPIAFALAFAAASAASAQGLVTTQKLSMDTAYYKAYTAASLTLGRNEETTKAIAGRLAKNPPSAVPQTPLPNVTYAQGGVAIMDQGADEVS